MGKTIVGVIAGLLVLAGIAFVVTNDNQNKPTSDSTAQTTTDQPSNTTAANNNQAATEATSQSSNNSQTVTIKNSAFSPTSITVKVGTKVTWTNQDSMQHDVATDKDYGDAFKSSELLSRGESYSFTFTKAGTYSYHCTPHPFMKATVTVTE